MQQFIARRRIEIAGTLKRTVVGENNIKAFGRKRRLNCSGYEYYAVRLKVSKQIYPGRTDMRKLAHLVETERIPSGGNESVRDSDEQYCMCRKPYRKGDFMVECQNCLQWSHPACIFEPKSLESTF